ncbi:MAG: hypothetical protein JO185_23975 [Acidobacteriaceae bacterium]|nr:hypothetical protein [Acidobacteriaceae bacterium]MBV9679416.1 hypothetical protein [Acidobacteriaceae bacterium]
MPEENDTQEDRINRNMETLRQVFEPLVVGLTPDVEPAVIYFPQLTARGAETRHDG